MKFPTLNPIPFEEENDRRIAEIIHDCFFEKARYLIGTEEMHTAKYGVLIKRLYKTTFAKEDSPFKHYVLFSTSVEEIEDVVELIRKHGGSVVTQQIGHPLLERDAKVLAKMVEERESYHKAYQRRLGLLT